MRINISGIDKRFLLLMLYNNATQQGIAFQDKPAAKFISSLFKNGDPSIADNLIQSGLKNKTLKFDYVDLGSGHRILKVDLNVDVLDFSMYDYFHGEGAALRVINAIDKLILEDMEDCTYGSWRHVMPAYESRILRIQQLLANKPSMRVFEPEETQTPKRIYWGMLSPSWAYEGLMRKSAEPVPGQQEIRSTLKSKL